MVLALEYKLEIVEMKVNTDVHKKWITFCKSLNIKKSLQCAVFTLLLKQSHAKLADVPVYNG